MQDKERALGIDETEPALVALRAWAEGDPGLPRANPDEIWVRARVDEILAGDRGRQARTLLGLAQTLTFDAAVALLAWSVLGAMPIVPLFGWALSKALVVALAVAVAHATTAWCGALTSTRL